MMGSSFSRHPLQMIRALWSLAGVPGRRPGCAVLQPVRIVVRRQDDDGVVRFSRFLESAHEVSHSFFQFLVRGQIATDRIGIVQVFDRVPVSS